jgi:hypothetical protein
MYAYVPANTKLQMRKWANEQMSKWANGQMGKYRSLEKFSICTTVWHTDRRVTVWCSDIT